MHFPIIFLVVLVKDRLKVPAHLILNDGTDSMHVCDVIGILDVDFCKKDDHSVEKIKDGSED
jgi:hypothetical protein